MGQPSKVQTTLLTPVDVVKAEWLSKGNNRDPEMLAIKPPRPKIVELAKDLPEYIIDPGTKTTYVKGKFLGKGGFARVHELTDLTTNQVYACKIIPKSRLTKPHQKEKILREIDLHQKLKHKNIVRFQHFFEDDQNVYIILENCSRKSLVHVLRSRKFLTEPEVRYFMLQLAEGVQYTHSQGVIHRDLKLGNMLLSEEMEVKIGDYGLATHISNVDKCGKKFTVCGTPNYIAPEVLNMQGHSFAADVWAMGCIMYAMLVGQPPFETSTLNETYYRITTNKYTIPSSMSEPARHLVVRMLQCKPSDRPSLDEIIKHRFFSSGYLPTSLPATCCVTIPKLPIGVFIRRASSERDVDKIANRVVNLQLSPKPDVPKIHVKSDESSCRKDNCFPSTIRQKLTNVLCPDKVIKKPKESSSSASMFHMLLNVLESIPEDCNSNPPPLNYNLSPFISKWVDYSNKYGFAFQLSNHSFGVMFNDSTRMSMSANRSKVEFYDTNGKSSTYSHSNIPSHLEPKFTLFKDFAEYMDENLSEGGELQSQDLVRKKIPYMKRWLRTANAVVMQLSSGTLQINFFKDHTKIVICGDGTVMYIDEERHSTTYSLNAIGQHGCKPIFLSRLQYAASVLHDFAQLEGDFL
ncbi:serine/threonine-protein kinase PLK1 [Parasteatoda tepidariorum]|uniref:serine/threonine-protein kinase PLK1 n=1 Tax=Parasteatoda tepidariorum TaxID=114398 RepID=UPI000A2C09A8|nr:serine/threonine-protein kinase PLK1 [Parasteatoda tepidariorum]